MPVLKYSTAAGFNDFRPVALTLIITKCFKRLVLAHIKTSLPPTLDPYQFAYCQNRCTERCHLYDTHSTLSHLNSGNTYVRMLLINFNPSFNIIILSKLITELCDLGINTSLCN